MSEAAQRGGAIEVFISYSHKDERLRRQLEEHLANLSRQGMVTAWHDRKITAGRAWGGEIDAHLNTSRLILLLISPSFMASDYCNGVEVEQAMNRHTSGDADVIPVILRPVDWTGAPFSKLQALPKDAKPVTEWANRDKAFRVVAEGVREVVEEITRRSNKEELKTTHSTATVTAPTPDRKITTFNVRFELNTPNGLRRVIFWLEKGAQGEDITWKINFELFERDKKSAPFGDALIALRVEVNKALNPKAEKAARGGLTPEQSAHVLGRAAEEAKAVAAGEATPDMAKKEIQNTLKR